MAKAMYAVVGGATKKIKSAYCVVGGVTKKLKAVYAVVGGSTKLVWKSGSGIYGADIVPLYTGAILSYNSVPTSSTCPWYNISTGEWKSYTRSGTSFTQSSAALGTYYSANTGEGTTYNTTAQLTSSADGKTVVCCHSVYDDYNQDYITTIYTYNTSTSKYVSKVIASRSVSTVADLFKNAGIGASMDVASFMQCQYFLNQDGSKLLIVCPPGYNRYSSGIICNVSGTDLTYVSTIFSIDNGTNQKIYCSASEDLETVSVNYHSAYSGYKRGSYIYVRDNSYNYIEVAKLETTSGNPTYATGTWTARNGKYAFITDETKTVGNNTWALYYIDTDKRTATKTSFSVNSGYTQKILVNNPGSQSRKGTYCALKLINWNTQYGGDFYQLVTDGATITNNGSAASYDIKDSGLLDFSENDDYCMWSGNVHKCSFTSSGTIQTSNVATLAPSSQYGTRRY